MRGKIIIAGGTGALGTLLSNAFSKLGGEVVVLSRSRADALGNVKLVYWDGETLDDWTAVLEGATAVVNLAGRSINTRFTAKNKKEIMASRVVPTMLLGNAISRCHRPPDVWINAGGISIYEPSPTIFTESDQPAGTGFLAQLSRQWEAAFDRAMTPATRKIQLRMSPILLADGGMLGPLVKLAKLGLGGTVGHGDQYVSWIHQHDFAKLVQWVVENEHISGLIHASSPNPVTNTCFMRALRKKLRVPVGIPAPAWAVRVGASLIGVEPQLALDGHRVVSGILEKAGFRFDFPELTDAFDNLML